MYACRWSARAFLTSRGAQLNALTLSVFLRGEDITSILVGKIDQGVVAQSAPQGAHYHGSFNPESRREPMRDVKAFARASDNVVAKMMGLVRV